MSSDLVCEVCKQKAQALTTRMVCDECRKWVWVVYKYTALDAHESRLSIGIITTDKQEALAFLEKVRPQDGKDQWQIQRVRSGEEYPI